MPSTRQPLIDCKHCTELAAIGAYLAWLIPVAGVLFQYIHLKVKAHACADVSPEDSQGVIFPSQSLALDM